MLKKTRKNENEIPLSELFHLNRRYSRSINLERDFSDLDSLSGYVVTERANQALTQILKTLAEGKFNRGWTLTGVYGTGKSSFAHFLSALFGASKEPIHQLAHDIVEKAAFDSSLIETLQSKTLKNGFVRAVVTAQREPISRTILRALTSGVQSFAGKNLKINFIERLDKLEKSAEDGKKVEPREVLNLIKEISTQSRAGLLIVIDELGKCLEYAAVNRDAEDLYLLQQITEIASSKNAPIYIVGLLHQAFSEYGYGLGAVERNEWVKIQGRFEEIPFTESAWQMVHLIGQAITVVPSASQYNNSAERLAEKWYRRLEPIIETRVIKGEAFKTTFPLHPLAALTVPQLCLRYAQNDRSLFTFLTSTEPRSLRTFLTVKKWNGEEMPLLKLENLYDYFVDTAQAALFAKSGFQRWTEVKSLIEEHSNGDEDNLRVMKTIGTLNLAGTSGFLRASREAVALALCDAPDDATRLRHWHKVIENLLERGVITYRQQIDELRLWEGSDFDIAGAVTESIERQHLSFAELLNSACPLRPVAAQRHSYRTGATRFFECYYFDDANELKDLQSCLQHGDGLLGYWIGEKMISDQIPATVDGKKPFVLIKAGHLETLRLRTLEMAALKEVEKNAVELQSDGVARREVRFRLAQARRQLDDAFNRSLNADERTEVWIGGQIERLNLRKQINGRLSDLCDATYKKSPIIWNEIINRQELTAQGAKASRKIIAAMLEKADTEDLGLTGNGPEMSVYDTLLKRTGIHRKEEEERGFFAPSEQTLIPVWENIERFCLSAKDRPASLDKIFQKLQKPPFGVKAGLIPILLAAVIIAHSDETSVYKDGIFIPVLGAEHFELLVKNPARFSVKSYSLSGIRAEVFKELEGVMSGSVSLSNQTRNKTLLGLITPFLKFVRKLSAYSKQTKTLTAQAQAVRQALLEAPEPDKLLFELLPEACGFSPIPAEGVVDSELPRKFRAQLTLTLKELDESYEVLLGKCRMQLYEAFAVRQDVARLREDLRSRASYFTGRSIEPILTRFIFAATETAANDELWLQSVLMVVSDKPVESWKDTDVDSFGLKLADLARRFKHLETIIKDNDVLWHSRAEARRVSLVRTDGSELHDIAWIDETERSLLEDKADEIIENLSFDKPLQKAFLAVLTEKILAVSATEVEMFGKVRKKILEATKDETHTRSFGRKR